MKTPMNIYPRFPAAPNHKVAFNGYIEASEDFTGELVLVLDTSRCSLDMKTCEKFSNRNIRNMCARFKEQNKFYSSAFANIKPPLVCPIKAGNYSLGDSSLDLSALALMPIDGYVWLIKYRLVSVEDGGKSRRIIMCVNSEIKIVRTRF